MIAGGKSGFLYAIAISKFYYKIEYSTLNYSIYNNNTLKSL